jgi:hypothetical protein
VETAGRKERALLAEGVAAELEQHAAEVRVAERSRREVGEGCAQRRFWKHRPS